MGGLPIIHCRSHDKGGLPLGSMHPVGGGVCIQERGSASRGLGRPPGLPTGVWADPPPPEIHAILPDAVNKRAVRILLECILVFGI